MTGSESARARQNKSPSIKRSRSHTFVVLFVVVVSSRAFDKLRVQSSALDRIVDGLLELAPTSVGGARNSRQTARQRVSMPNLIWVHIRIPTESERERERERERDINDSASPSLSSFWRQRLRTCGSSSTRGSTGPSRWLPSTWRRPWGSLAA